MSTESFWEGKFGDEYTARNAGEAMLESNIDFFSKALAKARGVKSIMEVGCNNGMNLLALEYLDPSANLYGVDINASALVELERQFKERGLPCPETRKAPASEFVADDTYDLVLTKGLLIHVDPDDLPAVYERLFTMSRKYIMIAEYYSPKPVEIPYRGHRNRLWKRDFAGEMLDKYPLRIVEYGFVYHRDEHSQDDINWWLLEKVGK